MYRALSWFIDCPRDSSIDWNINNAWAAGEGIISRAVIRGLKQGRHGNGTADWIPYVKGSCLPFLNPLFTALLIMPSPAAQALLMFQSILLSLGQSINHYNALYISNYYMNNTSMYKENIQIMLEISGVSDANLSQLSCL
jgi:hypothetical protein